MTSAKTVDIKKNRGDVFHLAATLTETHPGSLPVEMEADLVAFLSAFPPDSPEWNDILISIRRTLPQTTPHTLLTALREYYQLSS